MNYERQKRLVERLLDRTQAGDLSWQEGVGSGTFQLSFPNNSVQIAYAIGEDGQNSVILILDSAGRITESFDGDDLDLDKGDKKRSWHQIIRTLHEAARRSALKADEVLDSILSEID